MKIEFLIGNEKRFSEFISKLGDEKVALISHTDLDGVAAAKVVNRVVEADILRFIDYTDLNDDLVKWLKERKVSKVIFTDIMISNENIVKKIEQFADILIIDHHPPIKDYNSDKTVFINAHEYCAAYMSYYLFSKTQNLEDLDWLVCGACITDWNFEKPKKWIEGVYEKYGDKFVIGENGPEKGKFWKEVISSISGALIYFREDIMRVYDMIGDKYGDVGDLGKYADEVQKEIDDAVERFDKEKEEVNGGYFWEFNPRFGVKSIVSSIVSSEEKNKFFIIGTPEEKYYTLSARRQDKKEDMAALLRKLIYGFEGSSAGGHIPAAGGHILLRDVEEFKKRVRNL